VDYMWDIGFDFNTTATVQINGKTYFSLTDGFVSFSAPRGIGANEEKTTLIAGVDRVGFNLFNRTNPVAGSYSISNPSISFRPKQASQAALSPLSDSSGAFLQSMALSVTNEPPGPSAIFGMNQQFPVWFLGYLPLANSGDYEFTILLDVSGPDGSTKSFAVDPEMIVGGAT
jgi:hypothetical protein